MSSPLPGEASTVEHPQDITVPSFFSLPRELRDMICHLVLGEEGEYRQSIGCHAWEHDLEFRAFLPRKDLWPPCDRLNIARVCRTTNAEANNVIYTNNKFRFHVMSKTWLSPSDQSEKRSYHAKYSHSL